MSRNAVIGIIVVIAAFAFWIVPDPTGAGQDVQNVASTIGGWGSSAVTFIQASFG